MFRNGGKKSKETRFAYKEGEFDHQDKYQTLGKSAKSYGTSIQLPLLCQLYHSPKGIRTIVKNQAKRRD